MISVSEAYKAAIDANRRHIIPKVLVYFNTIPAEFSGDEVISLNLLEEARAETGNPLGAVSSNELTITLDNTNHHFTPTNTASPYYNRLKPNVKIEAFLALEITTGVYEDIPLGIFYTAEWKEGTVTGYDALCALGAMDVPMVKPREDTTIGTMFADLFEALEVDSFYVDPRLIQSVSIGWLPKGSVNQALQLLCAAGNCFVNVDRFGRIKAQKNTPSGVAVATLKDSNQILHAENPQKYLGIYNAIKLTYSGVRMGRKREEILKIEDAEIESGTSVLDKTDFSGGPIGQVEKVTLLKPEECYMSTVAYDAWSIIINTENPGEDEKLDITVTGFPITVKTRHREVINEALVADWGRKELQVENYLLQHRTVAQEYAEEILSIMSDPFKNFYLDVRGNPALEIGDVVTVDDPTDRIPLTNIVIERIELAYDGGLSGTIEGSRTIL
ncbi:hypothetical protein [Dehalobacterium formicoaceticum]|uniref:hypothetical protein n=1 Tax=Dehalobacterium formicoaceticum TaxID=51515 RepID=UPI000B7F44C6|nr:hypothetical protein [Dehalobacterium formicoaceticum]